MEYYMFYWGGEDKKYFSLKEILMTVSELQLSRIGEIGHYLGKTKIGEINSQKLLEAAVEL